MADWVSRVFGDTPLASCIVPHLTDIEDVVRLYLGTCRHMRAIALANDARWAPTFNWIARLQQRLSRFRAGGISPSVGVLHIALYPAAFTLQNMRWHNICLGGCGCSIDQVTLTTRVQRPPPYPCCVACFNQMHCTEYAFADHTYFAIAAQGSTLGVSISDCMLEYLLSMAYENGDDWADWCHEYQRRWHYSAVLGMDMRENTLQFVPKARIRQLIDANMTQLNETYIRRRKRKKYASH